MAERMVATIAAEGDLLGGWPWAVWLLIPLAILLAYVTARVVGPDGDPPPSSSTGRGVSEHLARRDSQEPPA
jgi:membrane protein implicated in regulation of membrane protease activity